MKDRFDYIDALRGFAILGVIAGHAVSVAHLHGGLANLAVLGGYGVQLFFVVSAFTIFLTFERSLQRESNPLRNFFIRRLLRIVPVYWFGILIYLAVYGLESRGWRPGPDIWHFPYHVFLVNLLHPLTQSSVVPGGWSISCEVLFYLTVPIWFIIVRSLRSALIFAAVSMIIGQIFIQFMASLMDTYFASYPPAEVIAYWYRSLPSQLGVFAIGILVYRLIKDKPEIVALLKSPLSNLAVLIPALFLILAAYYTNLPYLRPHYLMAIGFGMVAISISQIPWMLLVNSVTVFIGRISYSCYIWHFLVLKQLSLALPQGNVSATIYFLKLFVLALIITIPLSIASYHLIEKKFMSIAKGIVNKLEKKSISSGGASTVSS